MKRLKKKMRHQTRERGFTIVELLTVFAIVAIMVSPDGTSISGTVYIRNIDGDTFAVGSLSTTGRIKTWHYHGGVWE